MKHEKIITDIESKIQLALVMSIFFPTFLGGIFASSKAAKDDLSSIISQWSMLVGFYLSAYVSVQFLKKRDYQELKWVPEWLDGTLLFGIAAFIFPILYLGAISAKNAISQTFWGRAMFWVNSELLKVSMWGLQGAAVGVLVLIFIGFFIKKEISKE